MIQIQKQVEPTAGRKIKGTLHWVSAQHAKKAEVRIYNHLFINENPANGQGDLEP